MRKEGQLNKENNLEMSSTSPALTNPNIHSGRLIYSSKVKDPTGPRIFFF